MTQQEPGYAKDFRRRLDDLLRRGDPAALREFLIAEGQWQPDTTVDAEKAMWMMIAGSPKLSELHPRAERWLMSHGYEVEAQAILGRRGQTGGASQPRRGGGSSSSSGSGGGARGGGGSGGTGAPAKRPAPQPHRGGRGGGSADHQPSRSHSGGDGGRAGGSSGGGTAKRPPGRPPSDRPRRTP